MIRYDSIIIWRKAGAPRLVWKNTACSTWQMTGPQNFPQSNMKGQCGSCIFMLHMCFEVNTQKQSKTYSLHGWNHVTSIMYLLSKTMFVWMRMWPDLSGLTQWWNLQIHRSVWIRGPSLWQWTHDEFLFHWQWLKKHTHTHTFASNIFNTNISIQLGQGSWNGLTSLMIVQQESACIETISRYTKQFP